MVSFAAVCALAFAGTAQESAASVRATFSSAVKQTKAEIAAVSAARTPAHLARAGERLKGDGFGWGRTLLKQKGNDAAHRES